MSLLSAKTLDNETKPDTTNCTTGPKTMLQAWMMLMGSPKSAFAEIVTHMAVLHDNRRHVDVDFDALVRQNASSIDIDLVADGDIVSQYTDVLQSCPFANGGVPADNSALDPGVVLDLRSRENDTAL